MGDLTHALVLCAQDHDLLAVLEGPVGPVGPANEIGSMPPAWRYQRAPTGHDMPTVNDASNVVTPVANCRPKLFLYHLRWTRSPVRTPRRPQRPILTPPPTKPLRHLAGLLAPSFVVCKHLLSQGTATNG